MSTGAALIRSNLRLKLGTGQEHGVDIGQRLKHGSTPIGHETFPFHEEKRQRAVVATVTARSLPSLILRVLTQQG
jgi:hypothetical protein